MEYTSFVANVKALSLPSRANPGQHKYLIQEDLLAYYCSRVSLTNTETIELLVMKANRLLKSDLKSSSFKMRIGNMNYSIWGRGNKNNSEQGKGLATFLNKMYVNKTMDNILLKKYINDMFGEAVV